MNLDTLIQPHEGDVDTFCGMVAIVGRPNVGKSTLLNEIIEQKVSITSRKPQTTRHRIMGIHTEGKHQAVYIDTPGLHVEEKRAINRLMNRAASSSIGDVELIIFVVEGTHWNADDEMVLNKVSQSGKPVLLVINKIDQVKNRDLVLPHMKELGDKFDFVGIMPVSATQGKNVDLIKAEVTKRLPPCEFYFPEDYVTDRSMRFMAAEVIR